MNTTPDTPPPHALTIGGLPARYLHGPGRYHAFAMDDLHLYQIDAVRQGATTTTAFKIDGHTIATATGPNFCMMCKATRAMARAIMAYKAKSHRQSKEWRKRKRAVRKSKSNKESEETNG